MYLIKERRQEVLRRPPHKCPDFADVSWLLQRATVVTLPHWSMTSWAFMWTVPQSLFV